MPRFTHIEIRLDDYHFETRLMSTDPDRVAEVIREVEAAHPGYQHSFVATTETSNGREKLVAIADRWLAVPTWFRYSCYGVAVVLWIAWCVAIAG